jgi:hypothetical protein
MPTETTNSSPLLFFDSNSPPTRLRLFDAIGPQLEFGGLAMSSEDPSHNKQQLVVPFPNANGVRRQRKSPQHDHEFFEVLSSPLSEGKPLSDEEWRQRRIDNILALLKANAELRALAVKLSDILTARGGWNGKGLDKVEELVPPSGEPAAKPRKQLRRH